jgi:hypothetical protein
MRHGKNNAAEALPIGIAAPFTLLPPENPQCAKQNLRQHPTASR